MKKVLAIAALLATGSAFASETYDALDIDKSGTISQEEAAANPALMEAWGKLDGDADGQLTVEEFSMFETAPEAPAPTE